MDKAVHEYRSLLTQVKAGNLDISNRNLDTGELSRESEYRLADRTYATLLDRLAKDGFRHVTPGVRANIPCLFQPRRARQRIHCRPTMEASRDGITGLTLATHLGTTCAGRDHNRAVNQNAVGGERQTGKAEQDWASYAPA
jgi:hypothetical protein